MSLAIIIIFFMAIVHFIYESIILPTIHISLKNKLFLLRDKLRYLKIEYNQNLPENVFDHLQDSINVFLPRLHLLTISFLAQCKENYNQNQELRNEVIKKRKAIEECSNKEIRNIYKEIITIYNLSFIANMGVYFFYIVPIVLIIVIFSQISEWIKNIFNMPRHAENLLPCKA